MPPSPKASSSTGYESPHPGFVQNTVIVPAYVCPSDPTADINWLLVTTSYAYNGNVFTVWYAWGWGQTHKFPGWVSDGTSNTIFFTEKEVGSMGTTSSGTWCPDYPGLNVWVDWGPCVNSQESGSQPTGTASMFQYNPPMGCGSPDWGCGDGTATGLVRRLGHTVVGVDWSMMALRAARKQDLLLIRGGIDTPGLPLGTGTVDVVILSEVIEHLALHKPTKCGRVAVVVDEELGEWQRVQRHAEHVLVQVRQKHRPPKDLLL